MHKIPALLQATPTALVAIGTASAAAFGPEFVKSVIGPTNQVAWFGLLFIAAIVLIGFALALRRHIQRATQVAILASAIDPFGRARGLAIYESARRYCERTFTTVVTASSDVIPENRSAASATVDRLGERLNELIALCEGLSQSSVRINLVLTMRNAAAFRVGLSLGRSHRREIVVHHGDSHGYFPAARVAGVHTQEHSELTKSKIRVRDKNAARACLFFNLEGRGVSSLERLQRACEDHDLGWIVEVKADHPPLARTQVAYESVVSFGLAAWKELRPNNPRGGNIVIVDGVAIFPFLLGTHLADDPDGPWVYFEYDNETGCYYPFE